MLSTNLLGPTTILSKRVLSVSLHCRIGQLLLRKIRSHSLLPPASLPLAISMSSSISRSRALYAGCMLLFENTSKAMAVSVLSRQLNNTHSGVTKCHPQDYNTPHLAVVENRGTLLFGASQLLYTQVCCLYVNFDNISSLHNSFRNLISEDLALDSADRSGETNCTE